jgi:hypothetical protein
MSTTSTSAFTIETTTRRATSKGLVIAAWVTTGLFSALMTVSGLLYVVGPRPITDGMAELGYPTYFTPMLGLAKLLGVAGILQPRWPRVREWAYAGFTFDLTAAVASHALTGTAAKVPPAALVLALMFTSYLLRRRLA